MKKNIFKIVSIGLLVHIFATNLFALNSPKGPFENKTNETSHRTIIDWFDNSTVGIVNSVIGAGNLTIALIANDNVKIGMDENNKEQIIVKNGSLSDGWDYSLGVFNNGGTRSIRNHEAGHSHQAGTLGLFYLPVVGLSYLFEGHDNSFIEEWADLEAKIRSDYSMTMPIQVGYGHTVKDGKELPLLVIKFSFDERANAQNKAQLQKIYEWVKTEILVPLNQNGNYPIGIETNLLDKTVRALYAYKLSGSQNLGICFYTDQKYISINSNPVEDRIIFSPLKYEIEAGVAYFINDLFKVELRVGANAGVEFSDKLGNQNTNYNSGWGIRYGTQMSLNFTVMEYLTLFGKYSNQHTTQNYDRETYSFGLTNRLRNRDNRASDTLNYIDFNLEYQYRFDKFTNNQTSKEHYFEGSVGYRL